MKRPATAVLLSAALFLLALPGAPAPAHAQQAGKAEIVGVRVGLAGCYKPGCWTPVEVTLRGAEGLKSGRLRLIVPDGDAVPSVVSAPVPEAAVPGTPVLLFARFGRIRSDLAVELLDGRDLVDQKAFKPGRTPGYRPALFSDQELIVTVGGSALGLEDAVRLQRQDPERKTVVAHLDDFSQLPTRWYGYEGIDTLVLSTSDPAAYARVEAGGLETARLEAWVAALDERITALDEWIRNGGTLLFCLGESSEQILAARGEADPSRWPSETSERISADRLRQYALSRLAPFTPGRLKEMVPLRATMFNALEVYCGSSVRLPAQTRALRIPHLVDVEARVEAADGGLPLVVRDARGFGQVVFLAADLDQPPLADWGDRKLLAARLLDYPLLPVDQADGGTRVMHYGYVDLAGQLRSALDRFSPGVWVVPFSVVVVLIVLYALAIGPGDYFFMRRVVRRVQLAWITFPLVVVAFSLLAYVLAHRLKGDQVRVNQIDLVDVEVASGRVRGTAWATVFSPRTGHYDFSFRPRHPGGQPDPRADTLTAWLGLSGGALGGMNPSKAEITAFDERCEFSPALDALGNVPIPVRSTKSLTGRWTSQTTVPLESELIDEDGVLSGTISNGLEFPLSDCLLVHNLYAYRFGDLGPGETIRVGPQLRRVRLKVLLTGRQIIYDEESKDYRDEQTPYDRESLDAEYVLRTMMFYKHAGGRVYTGLSNGYQGFVDFSHLLKTNRAVLIARPGDPTGGVSCRGADLVCDGEPVPEPQLRHRILYRFVFAVGSRQLGVGSWEH